MQGDGTLRGTAAHGKRQACLAMPKEGEVRQFMEHRGQDKGVGIEEEAALLQQTVSMTEN